MNKITHEGKDYEVLPLDRISEITNAKLAGGKVVEAEKLLHPMAVSIKSPADKSLQIVKTTFRVEEFEGFGIQPLKLLPKVPMEFVGGVVDTVMGANLIRVPDDMPLGTKFRCVEVTE